MESTYSTSSFSGLVSSNRRFVFPLYFWARPKFKQMDLACPICKYPLGSGGNRVQTIPLFLLFFKSSSTILSIKFNDLRPSVSLFSVFMKKYILFRSLIIYPYNLTKVNDFIQCCIKCFKNM